MRRVARRAAAVPVAALGLLGCGGEEAADPGVDAATGVAAVIAQRLDVDPDEVDVTCPDDLEAVAGERFSCSVAALGAPAVDLDLTIGSDGVVALERAVVPTAATEAYLVTELAGAAEGAVEVDCGEPPLLVAAVGDELRCGVVRTADGANHVVVVTFLALDGTVRYRVEPAGTVAGPQPP